jgi:isocitrate/isopropylmalate dehydrogenase
VLMLDELGEDAGSARLMDALEAVCRDGPRTGDIGGDASTSQVGDAIAERLHG